jgi:hypothetical protein
MSLEFRNASSVAQPALTIEVNDDGGTPQPAKIAQIRDANNVARTFWQAMAATASPTSKAGYGNSPSAADILVGPFAVSVSGGAPPYTYDWSSFSGWTVISDTAASTMVRADDVIAGDIQEATFSCTVTDANGLTATTNSVTATAQNINAS